MPKSFAGHGVYHALRGPAREHLQSLANDPPLYCKHKQSELRIITYQTDEGEQAHVQRCQVCFDQRVDLPADMTIEISRTLPWYLRERLATQPEN